MSQRLTLPINKMKITANYQNAKYLSQFGFAHYGVDAVSAVGATEVYALGDGEIVAAGQDAATITGANSRMGNCIVIVYRDVLCNDGRTRDLACRMFHFDKLLCEKGGKVTAGTLIGRYGSTGAYVTGAHLHIEFDSDIAYPQYAVGVSQGGNIIKKGTVNSIVDPSRIWYIGGGQSIAGAGDGWSAASDLNIPAITKDPAQEEGTAALKSRIAVLEDKLVKIKALAEM